MGFRFQKRVRLLPGVRLNFSLGGVSLSGGVPGARVTLGKRGIERSLGIPGSGLYHREFVWKPGQGQPKRRSQTAADLGGTEVSLDTAALREVIDRIEAGENLALRRLTTGRKFSLRELRAKLRRMEAEDAREAAQDALQAERAAYREVLDHWRDLPRVPTAEEVEAALQPQPLPPLPPTTEAARAAVREALEDDLLTAQRPPLRWLPKPLRR